MYELTWVNKNIWKKEKIVNQNRKSIFSVNKMTDGILLYWREHCIECVAPYCYKTCPLFLIRKDGNCCLTNYGTYPNQNFKGLFNFGADIRFRKWGVLVADLNESNISLPIIFHQILQKILFYRPKLTSAIFYYLNKKFKKKKNKNWKKSLNHYYFVMECFSTENEAFFLTLERHFFTEKGGAIGLRRTFKIIPGYNLYIIPVKDFNFKSNVLDGKIIIFFDDNEYERRIIFNWLDFVKYKKKKPKKKKLIKKTLKPARKIKCVAWDLDNTLWKGILAESSNEDIKLREGVLEIIKQLDKRGIIQTIVSKNNFDLAWPLIKGFEIEDYFIYPIINWGQKSENLKIIAKKLNINLDTFALIDDSIFERKEVKSALPQVRVYDIKEKDNLLTKKEFDIPITEISKKRRLLYLSQIDREKARAIFSGDYESFLMKCNMEMKIFTPKHKNHVKRCRELIQRSNQLNLSTKRYSETEFNNLLIKKGILNVAFEIKDTFGNYGIIGFASIDEIGEHPRVLDFVISCRAAVKNVEETFFKWLIKREKGLGKSSIFATLIKTTRNKALIDVFKKMPFNLINQEKTKIYMELKTNAKFKSKNVIKITEVL